MKYLILILILLVVDFLVVDFIYGDMASFRTLGNSGHIICYSGGKIIYEGNSTGSISSNNQSDGYYFKDAKTGHFITVSGQCIIEN